MNEKYFIVRCDKQIENINEKLVAMRQERDLILSEISNLENIRDLLKKARGTIKQ